MKLKKDELETNEFSMIYDQEEKLSNEELLNRIEGKFQDDWLLWSDFASNLCRIITLKAQLENRLPSVLAAVFVRIIVEIHFYWRTVSLFVTFCKFVS